MKYYIEVMSVNALSTAVDCGDPDGPENGDVDFSSTAVGSIAAYTCHPGYNLVGDAARLCLVNGNWGGYAPVCKSKYIQCMSEGERQKKVENNGCSNVIGITLNVDFLILPPGV